MKKVLIIPTEETSWGIADRYDIKDVSGNLLYENIKQDELEALIKNNKYQVIYGEKYV